MKRTLFLLLTLLLAGSGIRAQTIYQVFYHFDIAGGQEDYKAFIYRNDDGTGFMRIRFTDLKTRTDNIVEASMQESFGTDERGEEDTNYLVFAGIDPKLIAGQVLYPPDNFVFQLGQEGYYEPSFVYSFHADSTEFRGELDSVFLLNQQDLDKELVLQYFTEQDEFYTNLFEASTRGLTAKEKGTRLLMMVVANTNDKTIGKTCAVDKESMYKTFSELAEFLEIGFVPTVITGDDFSKANVDKALNALRPTEQDIVVFYYSGHGFSDRNDAYSFPYLDLRDKSFQAFGGQYTLNMEAIYKKIKLKGGRLNLVLSDCCNNDPTQTSNISQETPSTRTSSIGWNKDKCLALFMNPARISILMTAARKGELSAGNTQDGGFFSFNFRQSLEKSIGLVNKDKEVSWTTILNNARTQTVERANRTLCRMPDESLQRCVQNPVFKLE